MCFVPGVQTKHSHWLHMDRIVCNPCVQYSCSILHSTVRRTLVGQTPMTLAKPATVKSLYTVTCPGWNPHCYSQIKDLTISQSLFSSTGMNVSGKAEQYETPIISTLSSPLFEKMEPLPRSISHDIEEAC